MQLSPACLVLDRFACLRLTGAAPTSMPADSGSLGTSSGTSDASDPTAASGTTARLPAVERGGILENRLSVSKPSLESSTRGTRSPSGPFSGVVDRQCARATRWPGDTRRNHRSRTAGGQLHAGTARGAIATHPGQRATTVGAASPAGVGYQPREERRRDRVRSNGRVAPRQDLSLADGCASGREALPCRRSESPAPGAICRDCEGAVISPGSGWVLRQGRPLGAHASDGGLWGCVGL